MSTSGHTPPLSNSEEKKTISNKEGSDINLGSLLRLFKSVHFDTWMAVSYLYKYPTVNGVQGYLANQLYKVPDDDVEFYLGQLCTFVVFVKESQAVQRFLMDKASKSVHFALKISWLFSALADSSKPDIQERCNTLKLDTEHATMNQRRPATHSHAVDTSAVPDAKNEAAVLALAISRKERCDYFKALQEFVENLGNISDRLRSVPLEQRNEQLKLEIFKVNAYIRQKAGMYMPLVYASGKHACIVNIPPSEAVVLSSRDRAPFLIYFEVIESDTSASAEDLHDYVKRYESTFSEVERAGISTIDKIDSSNGDISDDDDDDEKKENNGHISLSYKTPEKKVKTEKADNGSKTLKSPRVNRDKWEVLESPNKEKHPKNGEATQPRKKSILFLREKWAEKVARVRKSSPFGKLQGWGLQSVIVKFGDDCRQERIALQLIRQFYNIWTAAKIPLCIRPYKILVLSPQSCLIEFITNSMSVHQMKKDFNSIPIGEIFAEKCGGVDTQEYKQIQANFVESLAAYSLVTYLLQIKDRHNGNILIDMDGHVVHIDFGFMLSNSPGSLNFESSPFKLTQEYVDFMGGVGEGMFQYFRVLLVRGFQEIRKYYEKILGLIEMMLQTDARLPCLKNGQKVVDDLKDRMSLSLTERELEVHVNDLINQSMDNWRTKQYDHFQYLSNGILY